jgi:hypothetical protein
MSLVDDKYQPLLGQTGVVMDIWGAALKRHHMGKKLMHKMMLANQILGTLKGYQYSFVYASSYKTEVALNKLQYEKISSFNAAEFEVDGVRCF